MIGNKSYSAGVDRNLPHDLTKERAMENFIYKLFRRGEWEEAQKTGIFAGSPDDRRDGFIHLSAAHQVRTTFDKYFASEDKPLLAAITAADAGDFLKWEVSRGGDKFPHLYGVLALGQVHAVFEIARDASGRPVFPPEIP
jgi:uncharacterized protein (DUF952 family)